MCVLKMQPSVWWLAVFAILHVGASEGKVLDRVKKSVSHPTGYEFEILLDQLVMISAKLQGMDGKLQSVEVKLQSLEVKLHGVEDRIQSVNNNQCVDKILQNSNSELLKIVTALKDYQSGQEQNEQEVIATIQKLDKDVDNVHNITRQIMNALPQVRPTTEIPPKQDHVTPTESSASTTTTPKPNHPTLKPKPIQPAFSSCKNVPRKVSGIYLIRAKNDSEPFQVYCEQNAFEGGWIVFQYRYDGSLGFYRGWDEFRDGFGDLNKEFWLGLEKVHQITSGRRHELIVELKGFNGTYKYARYDAFEIGSESDQYILKDIGKYNGTAGDRMSYNKGRKFSTKDRDNDERPDFHCVHYQGGAWWHSNGGCTATNLNGQYINDINIKSMFWWQFYNSFNRDYQGMRYTRMMIRELE